MTPPFASVSVVPLRWGIVATGKIAGVFARGLKEAKTGVLLAVGSRSTESAGRFAEEHGIAAAHTHGSYAALLADERVEAVYVATPHPGHKNVVLAALAAGKHVLCEKPMGMNLREVEAMQTAAVEANRTLMEAWMYRCHPQTDKLLELVRGGAIGTLRHVQGAFSFRADFDPKSRAWNRTLGGGGILDVGGYPLSYARLLAGVAQGKAFAEPEELYAVGQVHPEAGVDEYTTALLRFRGNITAEVSCGVGVHQDNRMRIYGTEGWIYVPSPFVISRAMESSSLELYRQGSEAVEVITIKPDRGLYAYEADAFGEAVRAGDREVSACSWADTRGNVAAQALWCERLGVNYDSDE